MFFLGHELYVRDGEEQTHGMCEKYGTASEMNRWDKKADERRRVRVFDSDGRLIFRIKMNTLE